jgi:hypothetical protein
LLHYTEHQLSPRQDPAVNPVNPAAGHLRIIGIRTSARGRLKQPGAAAKHRFAAETFSALDFIKPRPNNSWHPHFIH